MTAENFIRLPKGTIKKLKGLRISQREAYWEVIERLIKESAKKAKK